MYNTRVLWPARDVRVTALGPPPRISAEVLRSSLDEAGFADVDLTVELVVGGTEDFPGDAQPE